MTRVMQHCRLGFSALCSNRGETINCDASKIKYNALESNLDSHSTGLNTIQKDVF